MKVFKRARQYLKNKTRVFSFLIDWLIDNLRKQPTVSNTNTDFPTKWRLRNERRNSILMTRHYPDLGSTSDWSCCLENLIQPIRSTTQIWVVMHHQYRISALVPPMSFGIKAKSTGFPAFCLSQTTLFHLTLLAGSIWEPVLFCSEQTFLLAHRRWGTFQEEERLRLSDRNSILQMT